MTLHFRLDARSSLPLCGTGRAKVQTLYGDLLPVSLLPDEQLCYVCLGKACTLLHLRKAKLVVPYLERKGPGRKGKALQA